MERWTKAGAVLPSTRSNLTTPGRRRPRDEVADVELRLTESVRPCCSTRPSSGEHPDGRALFAYCSRPPPIS